MTQLTLDLPKHKNGNGGHRAGHRQFRKQLQGLVDDLRAAEALRAEELKRVGELRVAVYRTARAAGVSPQLLRALMDLNTRSAS